MDASTMGNVAALVVIPLVYLALVAVVFWILFETIRGAVRAAMDDHFRKMQWYEKTGLWYGGRPPKGLPGATPMTRAERKSLPKDAQPQRG